MIITDCIPVIATGMQQPEMKALVAKHLHRREREMRGLWVLANAPQRSMPRC
jgi:hypothetical protein